MWSMWGGGRGGHHAELVERVWPTSAEQRWVLSAALTRLYLWEGRTMLFAHSFF